MILLEEDMMPGGAPVDMYVTYMCGAPRVGVFIDMVRELNQKHSLSITPATRSDNGHGIISSIGGCRRHLHKSFTAL
ncbi:hypothetical protein SFC43_29400 [Bacteroides sp. CR5/BHMF/2]|nr:hypothetical protein [Bacteroides sp. CR5/BHMF/2]